SDRLDKFPIDFWYDQGEQVIEFLRQKKYKDVYIIGSSGGALAAINAALEAPDLVDKLIADSFEGEVPLKAYTENI
ncbi:alpha/beta fold hydrolase, partial [Clostridium perfringens]